MSNEIEQWKNECEAFQSWFKALGGNIGSDEQMSEAFIRIEAKSVSDNKLYELLEPKEDVDIPEHSEWKKAFDNI